MKKQTKAALKELLAVSVIFSLFWIVLLFAFFGSLDDALGIQ